MYTDGSRDTRLRESGIRRPDNAAERNSNASAFPVQSEFSAELLIHFLVERVTTRRIWRRHSKALPLKRGSACQWRKAGFVSSILRSCLEPPETSQRERDTVRAPASASNSGNALFPLFSSNDTKFFLGWSSFLWNVFCRWKRQPIWRCSCSHTNPSVKCVCLKTLK